MLTLIIFLIILAVLVLVHEFGHFVVAKFFGIRVDEFGLGFPPRMIGWKPKGSETTYSLNWIPFGGFVKIFGEDGQDDLNEAQPVDSPGSSRSFIHKNRLIQVAVLIAGIAFNIIFAWILISAGYLTGLPTSTSDDLAVRYPSALTDTHLTVTSIIAGSPADKDGLQVGDVLLSVSAGPQSSGAADALTGSTLTPDSLQQFIAAHGTSPLTLSDERGAQIQTVTITPAQGIITGKAAIGISMDMIGRLRLSFFQAFYEGGRLTINLIQATTVGISTFIYQSISGHADLSQVTGPVGIEGLVGDARQLGFIYLLSFTALISINLAVINLVPFPALDGGRILFVLIEAIKRSRINPKIANTVNTIGFSLIILLLVVITYREVAMRFF